MEKNKYYTPKIEEFHIGFEYEFKHKSGEWETMLINNLTDLDDTLDWDFPEGKVRVKYLDKEDIESLGWELEFYTLSEGNKIEILRLKSFIITSYSVLDSKGLTIDISSSGLNRIFRGKVKNKSEFKKLMLQLGIN